MMPEFPARDDFERQIPGAAHLEQGVARDGIERLDAAIKKHGQPGKFTNVIRAVLLRQHDLDDLGGKESEKEPGQKF